jgi:hypothetical protein
MVKGLHRDGRIHSVSVRELKPSDPPSWFQGVLDLLEEAGPLTSAQLAERVGGKEHAVDRALLASSRVHAAEDGWYHLQVLAQGAVFTHIATEAELDAGVLLAEDDLALWGHLASDGMPRCSGSHIVGQIRTDFDDERFGHRPVLVGDDGWLAEFAADDLLAVRLRGNCLEITKISPEETAHSEPITKVIRHFDRAALAGLAMFSMSPGDREPAAPIIETIGDLLASEAAPLDDPLPPLGPLLRSVKLEVRDGYVGVAGTPWDVRDIRGLEGEEIMEFSLASGALRLLGEVDGLDLAGLWKKITSSLSVLSRIADEVEFDPLEDEVLAVLRDAAATPAQRALTALLAARSAEGDDRPGDAEKLIGQALADDGGLVPALLDAGEYAACRGEVVRADSLLRRAGLTSDPGLRRQLRPLLSIPDGGKVGRNQPCPCGSGQKYKKCCLGSEFHPLPLRASVLYQLLVTYAMRAAKRMDVEMLAERCGSAAETMGALMDLALFDGGIAGSFASERGTWLREDERELLAQWCQTPLRLYEVVSIRPGVDVTVRSLSGSEPEEVVLRDRTLSQSVRRLDLMLARLLEDGSGRHLFCDPFQVSRHRRPQLLDLLLAGHTNPCRIAEFFGPQRMPRLTNRDARELVQCSAAYEVPDGDWTALADRLAEDGDDRLVATRGRAIRGFIRRDGSRWIIEASSLERLRELQALVVEAAPQARLITESTVPMDKAIAGQPPASLPRLSENVSRDEIEQVTRTFMVQQEQQWIGKNIPALGGLSPRQAVERGGAVLDALGALLDDFDWSARSPADMSGQRIRMLLGLPAGPS